MLWAGWGLKFRGVCASVGSMKNNKKKSSYKVIEHYKVEKSQYGKVVKNNQLKPHEEDMINCLASYGFNVETIVPSNIPHSKNPDILMMGTFWEMKGPQTTNENTIRVLFRRAVKQANGKAIFDLRRIKKDPEGVKQYILNLFTTTRGMRRIMIIEQGKILDFLK